MSVIVACRASDGTIVFGAERQVTGEDERREMGKLTFHPLDSGTALIGMAASDVNLAFSRKTELRRALNKLRKGDDPLEVVRRHMSCADQNDPSKVQLLCAVVLDASTPPKLMGISESEVVDLNEHRICGVGSGDGAALGLLKQMDKRHGSLRDTQIAVCASVWLAKQTDPLCGGATDIWWLCSGSATGSVSDEQIRSWESYFERSLPVVLKQWIEVIS